MQTRNKTETNKRLRRNRKKKERMGKSLRLVKSLLMTMMLLLGSLFLSWITRKRMQCNAIDLTESSRGRRLLSRLQNLTLTPLKRDRQTGRQGWKGRKTTANSKSFVRRETRAGQEEEESVYSLMHLSSHSSFTS